MVLLQIHSKLNVCNFVGMHSDLTFYRTLFRGLLFSGHSVYFQKKQFVTIGPDDDYYVPLTLSNWLNIIAIGCC